MYKITKSQLLKLLEPYKENIKNDPKWKNKPIEKPYKIYSQRDPKWANDKLGFGSTTIGSHGCFVTCLAMMAGIPPNETNQILKREKAFYKDLIISEKAAKALNLNYYGRNYNISGMPNWSPSIKEVDFSPSPGKQQHFVLRIIEKDHELASKYGALIVDPWTGKHQRINYYPFVSYREFQKK